MKTSKKYDQIKQNFNQNVFEFVAYFEILKYELKSYIETQKRNHFLNRLKNYINQTINDSINIFVIRVAFVARTQRIKNTRFKKINQNDQKIDFDQNNQKNIENNFDRRNFKNERDNIFSKNIIINREFDNSTNRSRFDN